MRTTLKFSLIKQIPHCNNLFVSLPLSGLIQQMTNWRYFFLIFFQKIGFTFSCKLSPKTGFDVSNVKSCLLEKNVKKYFKMLSAGVCVRKERKTTNGMVTLSRF